MFTHITRNILYTDYVEVCYMSTTEHYSNIDLYGNKTI